MGRESTERAEKSSSVKGGAMAVKEMAADPLGKHIHIESIANAIEEARKSLWQSRPTEGCDRSGDGPPKLACKACFGTGRTIKARLLKKGGK